MKREQLNRDELFALYKLAIEEYRFQVQLNWDRTKHFFVLNAAILAAGTGLLRLGEIWSTKTLTTLVFFTGALVAAAGAQATKRGHDYYRKALHKKTLIAELLGFLEAIDGLAGANIEIGTISSPQKSREILEAPTDYFERSLSPSSITHTAWMLNSATILLDLAAMIIVWLA